MQVQVAYPSPETLGTSTVLFDLDLDFNLGFGNIYLSIYQFSITYPDIQNPKFWNSGYFQFQLLGLKFWGFSLVLFVLFCSVLQFLKM